MDTKIQELTDKIYKEGVEKGNKEAERIIKEAKTQKESMIGAAQNEAQQIIAAARKQAEDLKKNTEAEVKLFASQAVEALKSEITDLITGDIVSSNVKAAFTDPDFMKKVILVIAEDWAKKESLSIQTAEAASLVKYFESNAKNLLDKGVKIEQVNGKKASFNILPADGSYKVSFGEDEFIAFFKEFLRPQLIEMLF